MKAMVIYMANRQNTTPIKIMATVAVWIAAALIPVILAVFAVDIVSRDYAWVEREYKKLNVSHVTDMSDEDMTAVFSLMMAYSRGDADSLEIEVTEFGHKTLMFNNEELSHMRDVRVLLTTVLKLRYILPIITLILLTLSFLALRSDTFGVLSKAYLILLAAVLILGILLAIWAVADFDSFWEVFHIVFLDLESSTFSYSESRMIRICPAELFFDMIARFAVILGIMLICTAIITFTYSLIQRKRKYSI